MSPRQLRPSRDGSSPRPCRAVPRCAHPKGPAPGPCRKSSRASWSSKNIRWGELVGGLLIVGCSVALVLSFWAEIAQRPVLKFSIFTAVTGGLFGLGLYTEHRWKLPTTSRGVLLIATLLVPLNFLAFAAFSRSGGVPGAVPIVGEAVALGLFAWLLYMAARVIAPQWPVLMTAGVLGLSVMSLAARYALPADAPAQGLAFALAGLPMLAYVSLGGAMLAKARRWRPVTAEGANAVLLMLGVLTFAAVFPVALVVTHAGDPLETVRRLAPLVALAAAPSVAGGLLLWRRIEDAALVRLRAAGSGVAVMGTLVMAGAIGLAWPHPAGIVPVAVIDSVAIAALAFAFRVPAGQVLAGACALVAYAVGFQAAAGHVGWFATGDQLAATLIAPGGRDGAHRLRVRDARRGRIPAVARLPAGGAGVFRTRGSQRDDRPRDRERRRLCGPGRPARIDVDICRLCRPRDARRLAMAATGRRVGRVGAAARVTGAVARVPWRNRQRLGDRTAPVRHPGDGRDDPRPPACARVPPAVRIARVRRDAAGLRHHRAAAGVGGHGRPAGAGRATGRVARAALAGDGAGRGLAGVVRSGPVRGVGGRCAGRGRAARRPAVVPAVASAAR